MGIGKISKAFTIVELVVTLVIIGIMAVVVMTSAAPKGSVRLEAACQKIALDLRYMHQMAIAEQVRFGISLDTSDESYFGYRVTTSTKAIDPQTRNNLEVEFDESREFNDIDILNNNFNNAIEFDSTGAPYNGSGVKLSSQGIVTLQTVGGSYSKTVRIEPETGKVSIQ